MEPGRRSCSDIDTLRGPLPIEKKADGRIGNPESERPWDMELPYIEEYEPMKDIPWRSQDSERPGKELPRLEDPELDSYYSTYRERIGCTPKEGDRGQWSKERGESDFIPTEAEAKEILKQYGIESITYKDGIPDFSKVAESTVEIENMTAYRPGNFEQCDKKCAEQWNREARDGRTDWTPRQVAQWRQENGFTWHERNDMKTCDLVPTKVNDYFGHLGGVSECKKRDAENYTEGDDFDE